MATHCRIQPEATRQGMVQKSPLPGESTHLCTVQILRRPVCGFGSHPWASEPAGWRPFTQEEWPATVLETRLSILWKVTLLVVLLAWASCVLLQQVHHGDHVLWEGWEAVCAANRILALIASMLISSLQDGRMHMGIAQHSRLIGQSFSRIGWR